MLVSVFFSRSRSPIQPCSRPSSRHHLADWVCLLILALLAAPTPTRAQSITSDPAFYGPYNGTFLADGKGLRKAMTEKDTVLLADSPWSMYCWVMGADPVTAPTIVAGYGNLNAEYSRYLALEQGKLTLWMGDGNSLSAPAAVTPGKWHLIAATFDGSTFRLYSDGAPVASSNALILGSVSPVIEMAPSSPKWKHFGGSIAGLTLVRRQLSDDEIRQVHQHPIDPSLFIFEEGSKPWPVQTRGQAGYRAPQDPSQMPRSKAAYSQPEAAPRPTSKEVLVSTGDNQWTISGGWTLAPAPRVSADAATISRPGFSTRDWWTATVPGTVLTTMVDRGVYPDPDYGLNNLAIPESLNKQDYWYRVEFRAPKAMNGKNVRLTFNGINYHAAVWLNGQSLGSVTGAFIRGVFDITPMLKADQVNALAVRISPPPHPGIPQEQSIKGGPGENGGIMVLDGPTFVATEGWDWIPAVRDRNSGIWQPVTLTATDAVRIGDPQVVTILPLPDTSRADVEITVPLENSGSAPVQGTLTAAFEQASITKNITVPTGKSTIKLTSAEFSQLNVQHPRLWWPNGYGKQDLYHLNLSFAEGRKVSDTKKVNFGIREITYELSLLDSTGHMRRVEYSPTTARGTDAPVVDVSHEGMREIPFADPIPPMIPEKYRDDLRSWVSSLPAGAEKSPAVHPLTDTAAAPYLIIRVNGVRIAARGGNWGMDDSRKRVSREHLEPYFRLHHDANINIIRNWVGQDTEEAFYDLADEYGLLIWNDFWESTQDYNIEAQDPDLFLDNARDTILRYRNHPSIVMWCGRNEGVPQPIINMGLANLIWKLDGTRYYSPSSNQVNLQNSGPYKYQDPKLYFSVLNRGFSVETGTPSFSTLESFQHWIPVEDQWPVSDAWAYHDWHQSGNGESAPFMAEIEAEFGAPTGLADFERKAQMLNYVDHRAIFEGMNAHLWAPNSGRLLWMTQPAWPSNTWQILSSDYDTQASFYGTQKACEPVHVQLDLSNYQVDVINTTTTALVNLTVSAKVYTLDNKQVASHEEHRDAGADAMVEGFHLDLQQFLDTGMVLVKLELHDAQGKLLADNFYWLGKESASYRQLNSLPAANVAVTATQKKDGNVVHLSVQLANNGSAAALANKLTVVNAADGSRILPAYLSDNYISLLPGESKIIEIEYPASAAKGAPELHLRGWNLASKSVAVK